MIGNRPSTSVVAALPRGLIQEVTNRPTGYRILQGWYGFSDSGKALRCVYYTWVLWLPVRSLRIHWESSTLFAPAWAIDSAKDHPTALHKEAP